MFENDQRLDVDEKVNKLDGKKKARGTSSKINYSVKFVGSFEESSVVWCEYIYSSFICSHAEVFLANARPLVGISFPSHARRTTFPSSKGKFDIVSVVLVSKIRTSVFCKIFLCKSCNLR